jgi:replication factor A2
MQQISELCICFTRDGDYVIVNGGLKGFQGKRHVVAYSVR